MISMVAALSVHLQISECQDARDAARPGERFALPGFAWGRMPLSHREHWQLNLADSAVKYFDNISQKDQHTFMVGAVVKMIYVLCSPFFSHVI